MLLPLCLCWKDVPKLQCFQAENILLIFSLKGLMVGSCSHVSIQLALYFQQFFSFSSSPSQIELQTAVIVFLLFVLLNEPAKICSRLSYERVLPLFHDLQQPFSESAPVSIRVFCIWVFKMRSSHSHVKQNSLFCMKMALLIHLKIAFTCFMATFFFQIKSKHVEHKT